MQRSERGIGLILALIVLALLSLLVAAMLTAVSVEVWIGDNFTRETQLVYLAEAGIEEGREHLQKASLVPSPVPFIKDATLLDTNGRQAGRYSVTLLRSDPLTLRSAGSIGPARRTIEVRLKRSGFPALPDAVTLNEEVPFPVGRDAQLEAPEDLERIVEGIARHATDVYNPGVGASVSLGPIGSPTDYRIVVVNGDCEFESATGYGILLVRGDLALNGTVSWNGLILVIGQGVLRASTTTVAWVSGAVFLTRTRANDRTSSAPLGTLLKNRGLVTFDIPAGAASIDRSEAEMKLANEGFPYVATAYREY